MGTPPGNASTPCAWCNQLWRENAEILMDKEATAEAVRTAAVGDDADEQTEHHFYGL